ncbi:SDR family oxidoreductase, partial [Nocardioides aquaticus]
MSGVAVVTGAASGIGAAVVARLERDGWEVVGVDRIEGPGIISADVTSEDQLARAAAGLVGRRVDALVCAAGIWDRDDDRYTSVSDDVWHRTWAVNVTGTMLTLRAFAPLMGEGGSVVTIASMAAVSGIPKRDAYTASKGAVLALSRAWA